MYNKYQYAGFLWPKFLNEWVNNTDIVRAIWAQMGETPGYFTLDDIDLVLTANGRSIEEAYSNYAIWRYFTGGVRADDFHFKYASVLPTSKIDGTFNSYPVNGDLGMYGPGGTRFIELKGDKDVLDISMDGADLYNGQPLKWKGFAMEIKTPQASAANEIILNSSNEGNIRVINMGNTVVFVPVFMSEIKNLIFTLFSFAAPNLRGVLFSNEYNNVDIGGNLLFDNSEVLNSGTIKTLAISSNHSVKTLNERFVSPFVKHNNWNNQQSLYYLNKGFLVNPTGDVGQRAKFFNLKSATIRNVIDGVSFDDGLPIRFNDPWYVKDANDNQSGMGDFRPFTSPYNPTGKYNQASGGVFLNQGYNPITQVWTPPYYSVKAESMFDATLSHTGKTHRFYFNGWSGANYQMQQVGSNPQGFDQKAVVFTNDNALVNANYKGVGLSNQQDAFTSNSQRKGVKAQNGNLLSIYESMGKVWLERSTNNGENWMIMNDTKPVDNSYAESPSIDYIPWSGIHSWIGGVYYPSGSGNLDVIFVRSNDSNIPNKYSIGGYFEYTNDLSPVIAITGNRVLVVSPGWYGENYEGLVYFYGEINLINNYNVVIDWYQEQELIPNTNYTSKNISIVADKTTSNVFHITWNELNSIKYCKATGSGNSLTFSTVETPSTSSTYSSNLYPSISLANGNPVISWTDGGKLVADKIAAKETAINESRAIVRRKGTSWGDFQIAGNNVNYTNNNSAYTTEEKTVIVWSEGNTPSNKWIRRTGTSYSTPANLSHSGLQTQVIAGSDYSAMSSIVFNSSQLPYYFTKTTTEFTEIPLRLDKIANLTDTVVTYGRAGIASINGVDFVFNTGDVIVEDGIIDFVEKPDTLVYSSYDELNEYTRTNSFMLNNNNSFYFSNRYYVLNQDLAETSLGDNDNVNFRVELVRASDESVVGVFDNIDYNRNNLGKYTNIFYEVDCSGIQPGEYYLRLVTTVEGTPISGDVSYALANLMNDATEFEKRQMTKVGFAGTEKPIEYALFQNYPNPFNPVTTITYQIPKEGLVTLKIYDILGKEVTTLINEEKQAGKYSIDFNASKLSSGVYLYELRSNEYKSTKKLLLMK
jgi:hypothetical protein